MRREFIAVLLSLIPLGGTAQYGPLKPDGRMWATFGNANSQDLSLKAAYVQGAIEGLRVGATIGYLRGNTDEGNAFVDYVKQCADKGRGCPDIPARLTKPEVVANEVMAGADKVRGKFTPQNASVLDIVRQTDKFYADYRNTPVCMIVAVQESISSLRGTASSEQELQMSRGGCSP
jgi:hypothetical protein